MTLFKNSFTSLKSLPRIIDAIALRFNTPEQLQEVITWFVKVNVNYWIDFNQLRQLRDDHIDELGFSALAFDQSIERAEANVKWMELHYAEIVEWIGQQNWSKVILGSSKMFHELWRIRIHVCVLIWLEL